MILLALLSPLFLCPSQSQCSPCQPLTGICSLTKRLSLRQRITATAIVFFNRFYSCSPANSLSSTDPALVATACVYVASKVEETPVHIRNIVSEATKMWNSLGYFAFPAEVTDVAEMEFYLLEDLQFHLVVHHPYKSLITIATAAGKGRSMVDLEKKRLSSKGAGGAAAAAQAGAVGLGLSTPLPISLDSSSLGPASSDASNLFDADLAYGTPGTSANGATKAADMDKVAQMRALEQTIEERNRMMLHQGDDGMPIARLEELDEQALQMAWFLLNDTYRTDVILLYPPHLIAIAAIFLALVLHDSSRTKMLSSKRWMDSRRSRYEAMVRGQGPSELLTKPVSASTPTASASEGAPASSAMPGRTASTPRPGAGNSATSPSASSSATPSNAPLRPHANSNPWRSSGQRPGNSSSQAQTATTPSTAASPATASTPYDTPRQPLDASPAPSPIDQASPATAPPLPPHAAAAVQQPPAPKEQAPLPPPPAPPPDAMTFLATLNVDLSLVGEVVQEMLSLYALWHRIGAEAGAGAGASSSVGAEQDDICPIDIADGSAMLKRLNRMRERRFQDLAQTRPSAS